MILRSAGLPLDLQHLESTGQLSTGAGRNVQGPRLGRYLHVGSQIRKSPLMGKMVAVHGFFRYPHEPPLTRISAERDRLSLRAEAQGPARCGNPQHPPSAVCLLKQIIGAEQC
jgi:hypothetical protein